MSSQEASRQVGKQGSRQGSRQASKPDGRQASKANKPGNKQAACKHAHMQAACDLVGCSDIHCHLRTEVAMKVAHALARGAVALLQALLCFAQPAFGCC